MIAMLLRKQDAPSYKAVYIEFPAPELEMQEKLNSIGVGISPEKNCFVSAFTGMGVLSFLVNQFVNADEVQFLAKRMDSFDKNELQTFYAAVSVEKPETVKDLINLTFNTHCYTVVADFSDIEKIGRMHELNRQGCMAAVDLKQLDGAAIGRELIESGKGEVTPFGVLYRNSNQPEIMYNAEQFPEYHYIGDEVATVTLEFGDYGSGIKYEYLYLPCREVEIQKALNRLGVTELTACASFLDCDVIDEEILSLFTDDDKLTMRLNTLNELTLCYKGFGASELEAFHAIFKMAEPQTPEDVLTLAQNFYEFSAVPYINSVEDYGKHIVEQSCDFSRNLDKYIDFKRLGEDTIAQENGCFTEFGYIGYRSNAPAVLEILGVDRQEQSQGMSMEM